MSERKVQIKQLAQNLLKHECKVGVAESCTGGMLAQEFTSLAGSSQWFDCGFVTYSNDSKIMLLDINSQVIYDHGAVSAEVAGQMAMGVLKNSHADLSAAITGVAGPDGGSEHKPVGTVYIATAYAKFGVKTQKHQFQGNRDAIRQQSVDHAIIQLSERLND